MQNRIERRLAAIFSGDMVGYSRLMEADERGTITRHKAHRNELIDPMIAEHHGRIVKTMGDGLLVEFSSVIDAIECAVTIQQAMSRRELQVPPEKRIQYRVGINVGDIVIDGDDILGDGVIVAARLEGLADPGGVCISGDAFRQVEGKLDLDFEDMGEQRVKNIEKPLRAYRVLLEPKAVGKFVDEKPVTRTRRHFGAAAVSVIALLSVATAAIWWQFWQPKLEQTSIAKPAQEQPDRPSIAVLPFQNMSDDASQEYFADGIAEDVITDLSKISGVFVIARNTSFQYRGRAVDVVRVGRELGVRYILEGSVRRAADEVRINAQLIDTASGGHVWAERYDGNLADVFAVQDQVTGRILDALRLQLTSSERLAVNTRGTDDPAAYDAYLRGLRLLSERRRIDVEANRAAQAEFEKAIRIDPDYALAIAGLAWAKWLYIETINDFAPTDEVFALAERSIALADNALAHRTLAKKHFVLSGYWVSTTKRLDLAVAELERARELQPSDPDVLADLATALCFTGRPREALTLVQQAMELNPNHPKWYFIASGIALLLTGEAERAVRDLRAWSAINPSWHVPYIFLAAALGNSGNVAEAKAALARFDALYYPGSTKTLNFVRSLWPMSQEQEKVFLGGLRLAGMRDISD